MTKELKVATVVVFLLGTVSFAQQASLSADKPKPEGPFEVTVKCSYAPEADKQSTFLPTYPLGINFAVEKNNNNQVGVDIFKLNDKNQPIKLIGHAELTAGAADLAEDSAYDFEIQWPENFSTLEAGAKFAATVEAAATFNGSYFYNFPVNCQRAPKKPTESGAAGKNPAAQTAAGSPL